MEVVLGGRSECEGNAAAFPTTLWTDVINAGVPSPESDAALARLCRTYWMPVYAFIRKKGHTREAAEDLVQGFFARFLEKNHVARADRKRGRFRSFLRTSVEYYLRDAYDRATRIKRGGASQAVRLDGPQAEEEVLDRLKDSRDPATAFEKVWASTLLDNVLRRLSAEYHECDRGRVFEKLQSHLWGDAEATPYAELSLSLGLSPVNLRVLGHRMRQRFREILREEVGQTVDEPCEIDSEIQHLLRVVSHH